MIEFLRRIAAHRLAWGLLAGSTGTFIKSGNYFQGGPTWAMTDGDIDSKGIKLIGMDGLE